MKIDIKKHNEEIQLNKKRWEKKKVLQKIYSEFYELINSQVLSNDNYPAVELGSGIGSIKNTIPNCIKTDLFDNLWIDQIEDAYKLSFKNNSISNLILFDVFHHLKYPGDALNEFHRVLIDKGRLIIFEPYISLFGFLVFGLLHPEKIAYFDKINWYSKKEEGKDYYAAQGNATRIFFKNKYKENIKDWKIVKKIRLSALPYILSGGYSKPQMYSNKFYPQIKKIGKILNIFPKFFATRTLIVLEKKL